MPIGTVTDIEFVEDYNFKGKQMHKYGMEIDNEVEGFISYLGPPNAIGDSIDYTFTQNGFGPTIKKNNPKFFKKSRAVLNESTFDTKSTYDIEQPIKEVQDINKYSLEKAIEAHPKTQDCTKIIEAAKLFKKFLVEERAVDKTNLLMDNL